MVFEFVFDRVCKILSSCGFLFSVLDIVLMVLGLFKLCWVVVIGSSRWWWISLESVCMFGGDNFSLV